MPSRCSLLLGLLFILTALGNGQATQNSDLPQDTWYSLYFQGVHSGYSHITSVKDVYNGLPALLDNSSTITKITVFGTVVEQDVESQSWSDLKTGQPFYQTFTIESGGTTTIVDATFSPQSVTALLKSGTDTTTKVIPIPAGQKIVSGDTEGINSAAPLIAGQTETDLDFDPLTLTLEKQVSTVAAVGVPIKDAVKGTSLLTAEVYVVEPEGNATAYQDDSGVPIRIVMPAGIYMVRCTKADAVSTNSSLADYASDPAPTSSAPKVAKGYEPSSDLAISTSVSPSGVSMGNERTLTDLTAVLVVPGQEQKTVTETAIAVPPAEASPVGTLSTPLTSPYLKDAPYLSLNSSEIMSTEASIVGTQTNSYLVVKSIHDWVYDHMTPEGSLGVPRSASDVIANPVGVCRDYAILYTSLARAAGIPTKINAGLVGYHGKFYYHAWASSYIGGSIGWLPVDTTMPGMFVDASHIPLGSGDPTVMFSLSDVIGNMQVKTLKAHNSL
jgi:hypothetical protein